jgi:predicted nucleotidyltransferase
MRIDSREQIDGIEILKVRDLLRRLSNADEWEDALVADRLGMPPEDAKRLLNEMVRMGYVEPIRIHGQRQFYQNTVNGNALGLATAAKPVMRKTADRILSEFMDRAREVNSSPAFLVMVKKVVVFGSYLTDAPHISDIDLVVELAWKEKHPLVLGKHKGETAIEQSVAAEEKGRRFNSFVDRLEWPETEVKSFLKSRSRTLSIHSTEDDILLIADHKVIFSEQ